MHIHQQFSSSSLKIKQTMHTFNIQMLNHCNRKKKHYVLALCAISIKIPTLVF